MKLPNFNHKCALHKMGILLLLLSLSGISLAQSVEIISVQHRSAEEIAEQLKALYSEPNVRIAGSHQQVTVRADDSIINEVRQLVRTFDVPLRQFLISVSSDQNTNTSNKTYKTRGTGNQSITVLEGHSAHLNTGQKKPVQTRQFINGQWSNTIEYIDMTNGVYIEPRLIGNDRVEIKILSQKNEAGNMKLNTRNTSTINTSTVDTTRIVQLGEWVNIGGTYYDKNNKNGGVSHSTKQSDINQQSVMIKLELMP